MNKLPISVVVPLSDGRRDFFNRYVLPSIESNFPEEIIIEDCEGSAPMKRNMGAAKATQEYLFFCDDDSILGSDCLRRMYDAIYGSTEGFAYSHYMGVVKDRGSHPFGRNFVHHAHPFDIDRLKKHNYIDTMSLLKRKHFPGFDEELISLQDWDLWLTIVANGVKGKMVDEILFIKFYLDEGISSDSIRFQTGKSAVKLKHGIY